MADTPTFLGIPIVVDDLDAMVAGFGAAMVQQQASLSQNLIDFDLAADPVMQTIDKIGAEFGASLARTFAGDDEE